MRVLVTGANGFIGRATVSRLAQENDISLRILTRNPHAWNGPGEVIVATPDISAPALDFGNLLYGVDSVLHLAGRTSSGGGDSSDELAFQLANRRFTTELARAAAAAGSQRFIFASSISVNGERTRDHPFTAADAPAPVDAYSRSKRDAESDLYEIAAATGLDIAIVRPPLVVGPGATGNLRALATGIAKGWPLPIGAFTNNRRNLVGLSDLVDLFATLLRHKQAMGQVFMARSGPSLSTVDLARMLGVALGREPRLIRVPLAILRTGAGILGRSAAVTRLAGDLEIDDQATRTRLAWTPPVGLHAEFVRFADSFNKRTI